MTFKTDLDTSPNHQHSDLEAEKLLTWFCIMEFHFEKGRGV